MINNNSSRFQGSLANPDEFTLTVELVPSRGGRSTAHSRALAFAQDAGADGRLQAVSITENAGGHPALSPEVMGLEISKLGLDVIIHLSCKDKNRNQIESLLFAWDRAGLRNLLVIAGDYPQRGYRGHPKPVFDLDTIQALDLVSRLNCEHAGSDRRNPAIKKSVEPTSFCKGVAISPFKYLEAELRMQYYKLHRKETAGADYVITQVGYDARKFDELLRYMRLSGIKLPVLGNVFIPTPTVAKIMCEGRIPGVVLPDRYYAKLQEEFKDADRGRKKGLLRAAKLICVQKGLGYAGAHLGGPGLTFAELDFLLNEADRMVDDWPDFLQDFSCWPQDSYYFQPGSNGELNSDEPVPRQKGGQSLHYALAKSFHELAFVETGVLYPAAHRLCVALDEGKGQKAFAGAEHLVKLMLFGCKNCGDCTLAELGFLCPQRGCAKYLLNGPCGGSRDGWCEVYPGQKKCLYVQVYERLKAVAQDGSMKSGGVPPRDWALNESSSWINFFLQRDHTNLLK
ncbi:MAG: methylenetetrahydrofolate reductase C-terminal domain-containing protein [Desulfobulbaceae bacterium]|nr:methylenetetrahydrofolate reductase C-terminal domain-containing protein [Desulfobulbaceae bacterium]